MANNRKSGLFNYDNVALTIDQLHGQFEYQTLLIF